MLVWNDTQRRTMAIPSWLVDAPGIARAHTEEGDLLAMGPLAAALLEWRRDVTWYDVGEGWRAAIYGGQAEPWRNERECPWAIPTLIEDGAGLEWRIPHILSPLGQACMDMRSRLTADGWVEEPVNAIAARAIAACRAVLPLAITDTLHEMPLDRQNDAIAAILEACYHLNALTIGALGLITGTLRRHGLRVACGIPDGGGAHA